MRLFETFYARTLVWARAPRAVHYLCALSFFEAFIFPIMPEVMLAPMMLAKRYRAFFYANMSLLFSLLGALVGYALGHWAYEVVNAAAGDPDEVGDLGRRYRWRAGPAIPRLYRSGARQTRVAAGVVDSAVR